MVCRLSSEESLHVTSFMRSLQTFPLFYSLVLNLPLVRVHMHVCVCVYVPVHVVHMYYRGSYKYSPEDNLGYCSIVPQALLSPPPFETQALSWPGT